MPKIIITTFLVYLIIGVVTASPDPCTKLKALEIEKNCPQPEYEEFLNCVENLKIDQRHKRQIIQCPFANQLVQPAVPLISEPKNCTVENINCVTKCNGAKECESNCPVCPTVVLDNTGTATPLPPISVQNIPCQSQYNQCYSACNGATNCQTSCPQCPQIQPPPNHKVIIQQVDKDVEPKIFPASNITTVIKLSNFINTTNVVNVPTHVNSTNVNNIHIYQNKTESSGKYGLGESEKGPCCNVVHPKSCVSSSNGIRCHHKKHKTCGPQCTSQTVHVQSRQRCQQQGGCQRRMAYIPQPQPACVYIDVWPFVACGRPMPSCNGCYDHYGYGYANYYGAAGSPGCMGCYDGGFQYGQMYRRGPVLRPNYYHAPPCHVVGQCEPYCDDFGCYGHENIDPAFGFEQPNFGGEDEDNNGTSIEDTGSGDWAVTVAKCYVIGDDGKTEIKNCTQAPADNNLYAASPVNYPIYDQVPYAYDTKPEEYVRPKRHNMNMVPQQRQVSHQMISQGDMFDDDEDDVSVYQPESRSKSSKSKKNRIFFDDDADVEYDSDY